MLDTMAGVVPRAQWDAPLAPFVGVAQPVPEVVVFYVKAVLSTETFSRLARAYDGAVTGGAFSYLRRAVDSKPSLVLPYASIGDSLFSSVIDPVASHVQAKFGPSASFVLSQGAGAAVVPGTVQVAHGNLEMYLRSTPELYSNGVPDVLVVYLNDRAESDADQDLLMERVDSVLADETKGSYVALFGGNQNVLSVASPHAPQLHSVRALEERQQAVVAAVNNSQTADGRVLYFTSSVWSWLMVVLFLAVFFGMAAYNLSNIQVGPKLLSVGAAAAKKRQ